MTDKEHQSDDAHPPRLLSSLLLEREKSSHPAVVWAEHDAALSYAELARLARDLASAFQAKSVQARDRVAILLPNSLEFAAAFFGALVADAVVVPLDIYLKRSDLMTIVDLIRPRLVVTSPGLHRKLGACLRHTTVCLLEFDQSMSMSFVDSDQVNASGESGIDHPQGADRPSGPPRPVSPDEDAVFILSSGTTGIPKAVRLSHQAILRNISMHLQSLDIAEETRGLQWLPMNYSYGLIACFLSLVQSGGTAVLIPSPEPGLVRTAIQRYDINLIMGTPALFRYLIEKSPTSAPFATTPIRYLTVGGDRCKRYALELVGQRLPSAKLFLTYGLTEAGPRVSTLPPQLAMKLPQSVGLPLKEVELFIRDDFGGARAPYELGEIVIRTPSVMNGYFGDPERTQTVLRHGLCHTGDIGYVDDHGFLYCVGRKDRQFKFGGRLVNPSVIEQCISAHPQVQEVTVFKIEEARDERICAKISTRDAGQQNLPLELERLCRRQLPSSLVPGEFRFEIDEHYYHKGKILVVEKGK